MIVWSGNAFTLDSRHNGVTIKLTRHIGADVAELILQCDDAARFLEECDAIETAHPDWHGDQVYAWLWDECNYGSVASPI